MGDKKRIKTEVEIGDGLVDGGKRRDFDEDEDEEMGKVGNVGNVGKVVGKEDSNCNSIQNTKSVIVETHF